MFDAINGLDLAWIPALVIVCAVIGVGLGLLFSRGHHDDTRSTWKEDDDQ